MLVSVSHSPLSALLFNILSPSLNLHTENWLIRTVYAAASQNSMLFSPSFSAVCVPCQKVQSTACHAFRCTLTHTHTRKLPFVSQQPTFWLYGATRLRN